MSKGLEYINSEIERLEYRIANPKEYNLTPTIKVRIDDSAVYKEELKILENIRDELKTHETPKKYLTYDDLMKLETKSYKVLLNGSEYEMKINQYDYGKEILFSKNGKIVLYRVLFDTIMPFINDLHLELVEE